MKVYQLVLLIQPPFYYNFVARHKLVLFFLKGSLLVRSNLIIQLFRLWMWPLESLFSFRLYFLTFGYIQYFQAFVSKEEG